MHVFILTYVDSSHIFKWHQFLGLAGLFLLLLEAQEEVVISEVHYPPPPVPASSIWGGEFATVWSLCQG